MFKDAISYVDFNGNKQTQEVYFHLSKNELMEMEFSFEGGYADYLTKVYTAHDTAGIYKCVLELVDRAYGIKSEDGQRFIKSSENTEAFKQSLAYDAFFTKILVEEDYFTKFVEAIMPSDIQAMANADPKKQELLDKFKALEMSKKEAPVTTA